jgi:hypothetical protein
VDHRKCHFRILPWLAAIPWISLLSGTGEVVRVQQKELDPTAIPRLQLERSTSSQCQSSNSFAKSGAAQAPNNDITVQVTKECLGK